MNSRDSSCHLASWLYFCITLYSMIRTWIEEERAFTDLIHVVIGLICYSRCECRRAQRSIWLLGFMELSVRMNVSGIVCFEVKATQISHDHGIQHLVLFPTMHIHATDEEIRHRVDILIFPSRLLTRYINVHPRYKGACYMSDRCVPSKTSRTLLATGGLSQVSSRVHVCILNA
ncbi:hypothetical protein BO82DRAFT_18197 [Aspergillus uvarum CBS 121591]|uniref:Uncharacterized protein n=1 Tax=Aspergillus uvarum CBS 121591 TaxID=1448315 RepID=A0A319CKN4_9EURO|nr:hypothetical protein BO82DRAFT_18197 [Aspergillus uvarum CBS 121591]PYH84461.1 hypothetical protein BO82DRAFT_18197 [Aspergillus uvarum CBS 121591]